MVYTAKQDAIRYTALTPAEVAADSRLRMTAAKVRTLIQKGELEAIDISTGSRPTYMVKPESVEDFIRRRTVRKAA